MSRTTTAVKPPGTDGGPRSAARRAAPAPAPGRPPALPLTWLYAPGDRPQVVAKALASGADVVVVDLEDAVARDRKGYARAATAELLGEVHPVPVHVRVNALDGPLARADLEALAGLPGLSGLRLPKVTCPEQITAVAEATARPGGGGPPLYALLESALGVERAYPIACAHPALHGIGLGEADLRADLGVREETGLDWPRSRVVVAARAAGLAPPAQSVHPDTRDLEGLAASCARGRALGFLGRAAIHPRQLPIIERAYLPTERELEEAAAIVEAATVRPGAQALADGRFVDAAVVAAARRTLSLARRP
ncbi:HpcH/HpaI aldolase/citrate lyase family protein [Streptomyces leeuwenhoekii]|uniref:(3S)-malyl-CoA thiolesterase n=1 Tax=Streptomyces leeuwenhoekii TaxID=1437453 RepID=A0A0F7VVP5_STRLW|nr:CoA ester lyase [Streptomyces leeuwenhoekii]CQR64564.1 (3S)-malyl-CoA thiolesterase [Streptomyces leeuwenhoekii]